MVASKPMIKKGKLLPQKRMLTSLEVLNGLKIDKLTDERHFFTGSPMAENNLLSDSEVIVRLTEREQGDKTDFSSKHRVPEFMKLHPEKDENFALIGPRSAIYADLGLYNVHLDPRKHFYHPSVPSVDSSDLLTDFSPQLVTLFAHFYCWKIQRD